MMKLLLVVGIGIAFYLFVMHKPDPNGSVVQSMAKAISPKPPATLVPALSSEPSPPRPVEQQQSLPPAPVLSSVQRSGSVVSAPSSSAMQLQPGQALASVSMDVPQIFGTYRFKYRSIPSDDSLGRWSTLGLTVVSDPVARQVSFRGPDGSVELFRAAMEQSDVFLRGCSVQAWTVYVDRRATRGFDLVSTLSSMTTGRASVALGSGGLTLDVSGDRIKSALDIISQGGSVEVVQNPYVRLVDGQSAKIESIQEVPTPQTVVANGVAQTSVTFRKVGLQLDVQPVFFDANTVRLKVDQTNGVVGSTIRVGESDVPVIQSQTVASSADMKVGQTLVLGGVRTYRKELKRGLFGKTDDISEGSLYVILSTYLDAPKAELVSDPENSYPSSLRRELSPPLTVAGQSASRWIDGELLPPKLSQGEKDEIELINRELKIHSSKGGAK